MGTDHEWTAEKLAELEDPDYWDPDWVQVHPPVPDHAMRVAVRFTREEFRIVAGRAEQAGMTVPAFLKALALGRLAADATRAE